MSDAKPADVILLTAVRQLAEDARRAAAMVAVDSPDHEFYAGVQYAAQRRIVPGLAAADPPDLARRSAEFRNGYLETTTMIAMASERGAPVQFRLPAYHERPALA